MAFRLARMYRPDHPVPLGVFLATEKPTYEDLLIQQIETARESSGPGTIDKLFKAGETWTVK